MTNRTNIAEETEENIIYLKKLKTLFCHVCYTYSKQSA